jgi:hypothetical protein
MRGGGAAIRGLAVDVDGVIDIADVIFDIVEVSSQRVEGIADVRAESSRRWC